MTDALENTTHLVRRLPGGGEMDRNALIEHASKRLRRLTRKMLRCYPGVGRWEETDDVLQNALIRLDKALSEVLMESAQHFWNLAAMQIRRELIDLARHHFGPLGPGGKHYTDGTGRAPDDPGGVLHGYPAEEGEPSSLEEWTEFHKQVERLPDAEREVLNLLWYGKLSQKKAAEELGISLETVKRRWQSARFLLYQALGGQPPQ
jgi:RNA polymerase sigma-70 factor (ECF subfamily)